MVKKNLNKLNYEPIIHIISIVVVILFIINLFFVTSLTSSLKQKFLEAEEAARPANIELTIINANCNNCFDIDTVVSTIKSGNVNITNEQTLNANDAQQLIQTYNIQKLPTVIIKGELNKTNLRSTLAESNDALIFINQTPPYFDVQSNKVKGLVVATVINADNCSNCTDIEGFINTLRTNKIEITRINNLTETQASDLINSYNIEKLPALILSNDASEYKLIKDNWDAFGTEESDGNLVLRTINPPYKNVSTGKVEGLVTVTYLNDSSCADCYDVLIHRRIILGYGTFLANEITLDVSTPEGMALVQRNNITLVPTIILSKEANVYQGLYQAFSQVSQENQDGSLVFTSVPLMGKYKNLETGEVIEPQSQ